MYRDCKQVAEGGKWRGAGGAENVGDVHFKTAVVLGIPVAVREKDGHRGTVPVHHLSDCSSPV